MLIKSKPRKTNPPDVRHLVVKKVVVIMSRIEKLKKVQLYSLFRDITRLRLRAKGMDEKHGAITKKLNLLWHHYKEPDNRSELLKYLECRTNAEQK
jgi:hypothetical protein